MDWNPIIQSMITLIINNVILMLIPVAMGFIIGLIKKQIDRIKSKEIHDFILSAVKAAQQVIPETSLRYDYAANFIANKYKFLKAEDIKRLIEAAVFEVKNNPLV